MIATHSDRSAMRVNIIMNLYCRSFFFLTPRNSTVLHRLSLQLLDYRVPAGTTLPITSVGMGGVKVP